MLSGRPVDRRKAPRSVTNGKLPGRLVFEVNNTELACRSFDVSRIGMGITADVEIALETRFVLLVDARRIPMRVVSKVKQESGTLWTRRYGLFVEDGKVDLELEFQTAGCFGKGENGPEAPPRPARALRFELEQAIHLQVKTFGTRESYDLVVENLSRSGLLVAIATDESLPFRVNTLLDMTIDPDGKSFPKPIEATGKIVRRLEDPSAQPETNKNRTIRLGIAISEIHPGHEARWRAALDALEGRRSNAES